MRNLLFLARVDLLHGLRSSEVLVWTFVMPLLFFFFFSKMNMGGGSGGSREDVLRIDEAGPGGVLLEELERRLVEQEFLPVRGLAEGEPGATAGRVLEVPADLTARVLAGQETRLHLRRSTSGFSADFDDFRVRRALYTVLADTAVLRATGEELDAQAFAGLREQPRKLTLAVKPAGERLTIPSGKQQNIPGTMVMFTLIVLLTGGCVPVVIERRAGLLRRLASTPITRAEIVGGRWLSTFALGLLQIGYSLLVGWLVFGVDWGPHHLAVAAILVPWAALVSGMSLWLSSLARSEGQVIGLGVLLSNVLAALGGCWWPIEITPGWMKDLAKLLPTGWIMGALHELMSFQLGPAAVLPEAGLLLAGAALFGWLGARSFRYE